MFFGKTGQQGAEKSPLGRAFAEDDERRGQAVEKKQQMSPVIPERASKARQGGNKGRKRQRYIRGVEVPLATEIWGARRLWVNSLPAKPACLHCTVVLDRAEKNAAS